MKENQWATIQEKSLYGTVQMNISQKRISSKLTLSIVTEKYFCLTLLYCWHSRIIWTTVNAQLQERHCGGSLVLLDGEGTDVWGGCDQCGVFWG